MSRGSSHKSGKKAERQARREARRLAAQQHNPEAHEANGNGDGGAALAVATDGPAEAAGVVRETSEHTVERIGALNIYRPGQGYWVRVCTAAAGLLMVALFAHWNYENLQLWQGTLLGRVAQVLIVMATLVLGGWLVFLVAGRWKRTVDFFVATEGEMRKVNWSSRKEVTASTKIVLLMSLLLTLFLLVVNWSFLSLFKWIGVLRV